MRATLFALLLATPCAAETVIAARNIQPRDVIAASDLALKSGDTPGGTADPADLVGLEARVAIYAGRPVRPGDLAPPALVDRNQILPLIYAKAGLTIETEGRALDRGGVGETIRVMNLSSRSTVSVSARVAADGSARISQ